MWWGSVVTSYSDSSCANAFSKHLRFSISKDDLLSNIPYAPVISFCLCSFFPQQRIALVSVLRREEDTGHSRTPHGNLSVPNFFMDAKTMPALHQSCYTVGVIKTALVKCQISLPFPIYFIFDLL